MKINSQHLPGAGINPPGLLYYTTLVIKGRSMYLRRTAKPIISILKDFLTVNGNCSFALLVK
jgi:hypothetical protein